MRALAQNENPHVPIPDMSQVDRIADMSIAARLRFETRAEHEAIEKNPCLNCLMSDDLTLSDYLTVLVRMTGFYKSVEQGLAQWTEQFPPELDLRSRLIKTDLLYRDLAVLAPDFDKVAARACSPFGTFASIEAAWGCLYVVEGSTLGGQLIARNLKATIGVTAEHGAAFHSPYGQQTGARWQTFKAALIHHVARGSLDADGIVSGARDAFRAMDAWLATQR